ncbi:hypothetical protein BT67DRAFT_445496, partial [Trichocladium antarcticum]
MVRKQSARRAPRGYRAQRRRLTNKQQAKSQSESLPQTDLPTYSHHNPQDLEAKPITPPQGTGIRGSYQCIIDYNHEPFSVTWSGSQSYPDLVTFPAVEQGSVALVQQSPTIAGIWKGSTLLDYGSHASIRVSENDPFPIIKLAHADDSSLKLIQHELAALAEIFSVGFPVAAFDKDWPIQDNGITCGYRMRRLWKLEMSELESRGDDIRQALGELHSAGFCHGDFNPSNIMKDDNGDIILIDFSFAGRIGDVVPSYFPTWMYPDRIYDAKPDLAALDRFIGL